VTSSLLSLLSSGAPRCDRTQRENASRNWHVCGFKLQVSVDKRRKTIRVWAKELADFYSDFTVETDQKRAFSETRFLVGFSVSGFPTEELRRVDRVVVVVVTLRRSVSGECTRSLAQC
jgi:hypothetical protein